MKKTLLLSLSTLVLGVSAQANTVTCGASPTNVPGATTGVGGIDLVCGAIDAGAGFLIGNLQLLVFGDWSNGQSASNTVHEVYTPSTLFLTHTIDLTGGFTSGTASYDGGAGYVGANNGPFNPAVETVFINSETLGSITVNGTSAITLGGPINNSTLNVELVYTATSPSPEPATLGLMGGSLLGLGLLTRRKK